MSFLKKFKHRKAHTKLTIGKKVMICLSAAIVAFTASVVPSITPVFAARASKVFYGATVSDWTASNEPSGLAFYNGEPAYCLQKQVFMPGGVQNMTTGDVYSLSALSTYNGLSYSEKQQIAALSYFGYGYSGRSDVTWYYATQQAIWDITWGYPCTWGGNVSNADIVNKKNQIKSDALKYLNNTVGPISLTVKDNNGNVVGSSNGGNVYIDKAVIGKTYTITASGDNTSSINLSKNDFGGRAKKNGNTVTVTMDESDFEVNKSFTFTRPGTQLAKRGSGLVLYSSQWQNLMTISTPAPSAAETSVSVTLRGYGVPVTFSKTDTNGTPIAGADLTLYKVNGNSMSQIAKYTSTTEPQHFDLNPGSYEMVENSAPTGYYKSEPVSFNVEKKPDETQSFAMNDDAIQITFGKYGATSGDTVVGAHIQIKKEDTNAVVDDFYTANDDTVLNGSNYEAGNTYIISELSAPDGFLPLETDISIQIPETKPADNQLDNGYYKYSVTDDELDYRVSKLDAKTNQPVVGASMQILDSNGNVLEEWETDGTEHKLDKTKYAVGQTYRVHEAKAPKGYYTMAQDVSFTINNYVRETYRINAFDYPIITKVFKADEDGAPVAGATLALYDSDGNEIDRWFSTDEAHEITGLENDATYTIKEIAAPKGYYRTDTPKEITIKATSQTSQDKAQVVNFEDSKIEYYIQKADSRTKNLLSGVKIQILDESNNILAELESKDDTPIQIPSEILEGGHTYTVHESGPIDGYYYSEKDQTFTVPETYEEAIKADKNLFTITVEDKQIKYSVLKVDASTGETVKGASLALYDDANAEQPLYTWTSTDEPEIISNKVALIAGKDYYIKELSEPDGYYLNGDTAKISIPYYTDKNDTLTVSFYNTPIVWHIVKQDVDGNLLTKVNNSCFTLEVYDTNETLDNNDDDTLIATLKTDDINYKTNGYFDMQDYIKKGIIRGGKHYRIHEAEAANGYKITDDVIQQIQPVGSTNTILSTVKDEKIVMHVKKVDENGNLLTTYKTVNGTEEGFEITIYDEATGEAVVSFDTSDSSYIQNGYYDISDYLCTAKSYVAKETKVPYGYFKAKDYSFTVDNVPDNTVVMVDPTLRAQFRKEDETGNVLTTVNGDSFKFQIIDAETNEIVGKVDTKDADISKGGWIDIGNWLQEGKTYRIHEYYAPSGYQYQTNDAYITTPGYYVESDGNVQNVIISPNEYVTFTIAGTTYTEFRDLTVEEFSRLHSNDFAVATINGQDVLVRHQHQDRQVTYASNGQPLTADTVLSTIGGLTFNAPNDN